MLLPYFLVGIRSLKGTPSLHFFIARIMLEPEVDMYSGPFLFQMSSVLALHSARGKIFMSEEKVQHNSTAATKVSSFSFN